MEKNILETVKRDTKGKGAAKKMRTEGLVPAILYGRHLEQPISLIVSRKLFSQKIAKSDAGMNTIFSLMISGDKGNQEEMAIVHDVQYGILNNLVTHIDFQQVNIKEKIHTSVPIALIGIAEGIKLGGQMVTLMDKLEIKCLPTEIPSKIEIDVTRLNIGDGIYARDIQMADTVELLTPLDQMIIHLQGSSEEEEVKPATEAAAAAPAADKGKTATPAADNGKATPADAKKTEKK